MRPKKHRKQKMIEFKRKKVPKKADLEEIDEDLDDMEGSDQETEEILPKWYKEFEFPKFKFDPLSCNDELVVSLQKEAERELQDKIKTYKSHLYESKNTEISWRMKIAKSGTSADKIAALVLLVQESPVYNLAALKSLVNMVSVSKKHQFALVIDTLVELFLSDLLKPGKKLKKFRKQPLIYLETFSKGDNSVRKNILCYWIFEDQLKTQYEEFLTYLNTAAHDSVQNNREKAIVAMNKLLFGNREQENMLLLNLINKLGDPVHKVASKVIYGLERVLHKYTGMKTQMLSYVEKMLFRPRVGQRAQYYGICFLSQFRFTSGDKQLAKDMIVLYFSFFKACVKTGIIDSRLMGALLVGVNRAYPFASGGTKSESIVPSEHIDTMYKVVHLAPFKIGLQALALLLQISNSDRFYNALYKKLLDKDIIQTSHQSIWLHLVFKALNRDMNLNRMKSFTKRILQMCQYFPVHLACGVLVMLSQLSKRWPEILENKVFVDQESIQPKQEEADTICNDGDSEEERYFDVITEDNAATNAVEDCSEVKVKSSWYHRTLMAPKEIPAEPKPEAKFKPRTSFDPLHRNPAYAGGEYGVVSELLTLSRHFHPSVALFARTLLHSQYIRYTGDPLQDFTLIRFLERFSFKNPKKQRNDGEDKVELFRSVGSQRKHYIPKGLRSLPVQSEQYLRQSESAIPVDEVFLYRYLRDKQSKIETTKKSEKLLKNDSDEEDADSDVESIGSVEFNDYLDSLMGKRSAEDIDFAEDIGNTTQQKTKQKNSHKDEEDSDFDDEVDGDDEDEFEGESDNYGECEGESDDYDEFEGESDDDGEFKEESDYDEELESDEKDTKDTDDEVSVLDFDDEDDIDDVSLDDFSESEDGGQNSKFSLKEEIKKKVGKDFKNFAVPTEKFSAMLEEAGRKKSGGFNDLSNKDNASEKQLRWESSRTNQYYKSYGKRGRNQKQYSGKKNKRFKK